MSPDEVALQSDLESVAFRVGEIEGRWGLAGLTTIVWPHAVFWVAAPVRPNSPARFYLRLDLAGYPSQAPTGRFWDVDAAAPLRLDWYPTGTGDTGKVFRIDWPSLDQAKGDVPGSALYHPFDRRGASDHPSWKSQHPDQQWHSRRTVIDYLEMVYALLNSPTYTGIRRGTCP